MTLNITFRKAQLSDKDTIFAWLDTPHMQEFWDNSQRHREPVIQQHLDALCLPNGGSDQREEHLPVEYRGVTHLVYDSGKQGRTYGPEARGRFPCRNEREDDWRRCPVARGRGRLSL